MSLLAVFVTAWLVGFSGAMAPGPISTLVVGQAARRGFWVGPVLTFGHAFAELAIVAALILGLRDMLNGSRLPLLIALVGGAFLTWMGFTTLRDALQREVAPALVAASAAGGQLPGLAWAGLATSFSNPYWFLWWCTVGASYVVISLRHGPQGVAAFYLGHILSDLSWNCLLAFVVASGRQRLPRNALRSFLGATGVFLMGLGAYFVLSGLQMLRA